MNYNNMNYAGSNGSSSNAKPNGISDTLTQGLQFQKYLKKISGFGPEQVVEQFVPMSEREQEERIAELDGLRNEYISLVRNFEGAGNTLRSGYDSYLFSPGPDPEFTNKHVTFDGQNGYVTKHGVFKTYDGSGNQFDGVNGCPPISGRKIVTDATLSEILRTRNLTEGSKMYHGQPCGDEGTNVIVTGPGDAGITYSGCYAANDQAFSSLTSVGSNFNVESCKTRAVDTGAAVFALRNVHATLNKGDCYTGATFVSPTSLGNAYVATELWTSKDTPLLSGSFVTPYKMQLKNGGFISIIDSSPDPQLVKQIPNTGSFDCNIKPRVTKFYVTTTTTTTSQTTPANLFNVTVDALNATINPNNVPSFSFQISAIYPNAPATSQNYTLAYTCNGVEKTMNVTGGSDTRIIIPACVPVSTTGVNTPNCIDYYLILANDGTMQVNQGVSPSSSGTAVNTYSKSYASSIANSVENPSYSIAGRKTGSNNISSNVLLLQNEYIASNDGKLVLIMQADGHLVLKTFTQTNKCSTRTQDGQSYGGADSYALYNFTSPMDNSNIGKLAYIDEDGYRRAYPSSMIMYDQEGRYQRHMGYVSVGNNLGSMPIKNSSDAYCKTASSANVNSGGYVFDSSDNCWIKNNNLKLSTPKTYAEGKYLNIKLPVPNVPVSCRNTLTEIDSTRWGKYKAAGKMTSDFNCGSAKRFSGARQNVQSSEEQLYVMALYIIRKMDGLQSRGAFLPADMIAFKTQLKNSINAYKKSINTSNTDNTINSALTGMTSDADLMVLQENTRYLFLSIFAVGVMVVALNAIKK